MCATWSVTCERARVKYGRHASGRRARRERDDERFSPDPPSRRSNRRSRAAAAFSDANLIITLRKRALSSDDASRLTSAPSWRHNSISKTLRITAQAIDYISYDGCIRGVEGEDFTRRATGDVLVLLFARDVAGGPHGP